jgi:hypothetical protein
VTLPLTPATKLVLTRDSVRVTTLESNPLKMNRRAVRDMGTCVHVYGVATMPQFPSLVPFVNASPYKGVSVSPSHGAFAPGYEPPPSDLDNLIAGRQREVGDLMHQAVSERILRGDVDISGTSTGQNFFGNGGTLS